MTWLPYDEPLVDEITARMDLRKPNSQALNAVAHKAEAGDGRELVCDLATGVGKTYLAAALVDYLAASKIRNILIVTPNKTIQDKTVANFTPGNPKYVPGADHQPLLITSENFSRGQVGDALHDNSVAKLFVFNVQQLIKPSAKISRKVRDEDEFIGTGLYEHLRQVDDLVVIADEHHVYRSSAKAFGAAIRDLNSRALVGLTATPDEQDQDKVIYRYSLAAAIADGLVKIPVIVYREDGIKDIRTQLADACHLRARKEAVWLSWAERNGHTPVTPVLFVVCQTVDDADEVSEILSRQGYLSGPGQVLQITSQSSEKALAELAAVESPDSSIRAIVSVDMLKEGWDVKNIGVIVGLRALASQTLTEQVLGRGLRLPFRQRVGVPAVDQVDLVAHDSYRALLSQKDALLQQVVPDESEPPAGAAASSSPRSQPLPLGHQGQDLSGVSEVETQGALRLVTSARVVDGETVDGSEVVQLASMEAASTQHEKDQNTTTETLYKVQGAPTIKFPRRELQTVPISFSLSAIRTEDAQAEGAAFSQEFDVQLSRRALVAERDAMDEVSVRTQRVEEEDATQRFVPVPEVREDLKERIWNLGLVEQRFDQINACDRIAREFLLGAGVIEDDDEALWGERRAKQATEAITELVRANYNARRLQPQYVYRPVEVPVPKPMPGDIGRKWDEFVKWRWYGDWDRCIQQAARFDAKTTEWALANIFDHSKKVQWWLRLYEGGEVWIERDTGHKYYPDFIVIDTDDVYWIVEGKSDRDANTADVVEKKKTAEDWARAVRDDQRFGVWRYVFATESHIRQSRSWEELLARTKPER